VSPVIPFLVAALVVLAATPLVRGAARWMGLVDEPGMRSAHVSPTPRAGGLAILAGVALATWLSWSTASATRGSFIALAAGGILVAAVGFYDDIFGLSPGPKLASQIVAAGLLVSQTGGIERLPLPPPADVPLGPFGVALAVLWVVAVMNSYNFMDGIDGFAAVQALVTAGTLSVLFASVDPGAAAVAAAVAGACAAFLVYNWSPASVFLGDAGSGLVGFALAGLPLLAPPSARPEAVVVAGTSLFLFLADASTCVLTRMVRGERWNEPHRQHVYQRLVDAGTSVSRVAAAAGTAGVVLSAIAFVTRGSMAAWAGLAAGLALFVWAQKIAVRVERSPAPLAAEAALPGPDDEHPGQRRSRRPADIVLRARRPPEEKLAGPAAWRRFALILGLDSLAIALSFVVAHLLRFGGEIPPHWARELVRSLPLLLVIRLVLNIAFGLHRWSFRLSGIHEGLRIVQATATGSVVFTTAIYFVQRAAEDISLGPPRTAIVIELVLTTFLLGLWRFSLRMGEALEMSPFRMRPGRRIRTVILGAGSSGDLLLRDLIRSNEHNYHVLGFVDDLPAKRGAMIGGRQVLGTLDELPVICRRWRVEQLLIAIPRLAPARLRQVLDACADLKLAYKMLPISFAYLNDRQPSTALHDLAPEDLLGRRQVRFDPAEILPRLHGRRVLVTGAAGSIGSEICRQVAACEPQSLVLADIDENGLHLLWRTLRRTHGQVKVVPEVVDIRDAPRVTQLGAEHRPEFVLHAAAHKHVPLLERCPEEAVKNNVFGCANVLRMAEGTGAERFVLISTDKAVHPSSVMGATKRVAELVVRCHARAGTSTRATVVRFGNVLGSAGSVVPIFKQQIARGGPVTVTDPDCLRFVMTIQEAVGLTLIAGLGMEGDLFVLEMGEPIRILDVARLMITMSGGVPDVDVPIEFTGLRAGEKLREELMTDEEAMTARRVRDGVLSVESAPAPADLDARLAALAAAAVEGDRPRLLALLSETAVGYEPAPLRLVDADRAAAARKAH
jgi:FlaA1/EpsC-like NDP-sugar epimerase/UDP-N-acetylmuramyl pentapeptide phosphotransferase/UDP-N-acetylglucosamine-1-phosphate transferase